MVNVLHLSKSKENGKHPKRPGLASWHRMQYPKEPACSRLSWSRSGRTRRGRRQPRRGLRRFGGGLGPNFSGTPAGGSVIRGAYNDKDFVFESAHQQKSRGPCFQKKSFWTQVLPGKPVLEARLILDHLGGYPNPEKPKKTGMSNFGRRCLSTGRVLEWLDLARLPRKLSSAVQRRNWRRCPSELGQTYAPRKGKDPCWCDRWGITRE